MRNSAPTRSGLTLVEVLVVLVIAAVLFADGHARFVRNTISVPVWRAIGTRAGGEMADILFAVRTDGKR